MSEFTQNLQQGLSVIDCRLNEEQLLLLERYYECLVEGNTKMNLTGTSEAQTIIDKHLVDSLSLLPYIKEGMRVCDVGTGAGFPGLILACVQPTAQFVLIDSMKKKCGFLTETVAQLGLANVEVRTLRAEEAGRDLALRESFDLVTARAVTALPALTEYLLPLVKVGGVMVAMKGRNYAEELDAAKQAIRLCSGKFTDKQEYTLAGLEARVLLIITKTAPIAKRFPRRVGLVEKLPL